MEGNSDANDSERAFRAVARMRHVLKDDEKPGPAMMRVLVDGRVFSTEAHDRGMGNYVRHLLAVCASSGLQTTVLLYRWCQLAPDDPILVSHRIEQAEFELHAGDPKETARNLHEFTTYLSGLIEAKEFDVYIDATPFVAPTRLDLFACAVVAVCYDFIPLKYPDYYLNGIARRQYFNGLARLAKADHVICISETVGRDAQRFLGIPDAKLSVIMPATDQRYISAPLEPARLASEQRDYLFAIMGSHASKNPVGALGIYRDLLQIGDFEIQLNVPTRDQRGMLEANLAIPRQIKVTSSISEDSKFALQRNALLIGHLSLEEGFGIPLLEGLFLGRKIIALDVPINRELLSKGGSVPEGSVFLIDPRHQIVDRKLFADFLRKPVDPAFYLAVRQSYLDHWSAAPRILSNALQDARARYGEWTRGLCAKLFSSVPGSSCGVADYSVAYTRAAPGNVVFFFSEGDQEFISPIPNVRAATYLDFGRFTRMFPRVPGLYNFAFSPALNPGIELMHRFSTARDVLLVHERRYFDGLSAIQSSGLRFFGVEQAASWLRSKSPRKISHLPPSVQREMRRLRELQPDSATNDLELLEDQLEYVPLGIDDRYRPAVGRAAMQLRSRRQIGPHDIVIGHCGLIVSDVKQLWCVASTIAAIAQKQQDSARRIFFALVGKIIDGDLFNRIRSEFAQAGLSERLLHSNPDLETDFDVEVAACDAIACFRIQSRGQFSHVFVRALALGRPVLVNRSSGYGYDPNTTIDDNDMTEGLSRAIARLAEAENAAEMRRRARRAYETTHRADVSLRSFLSVVPHEQSSAQQAYRSSRL